MRIKRLRKIYLFPNEYRGKRCLVIAERRIEGLQAIGMTVLIRFDTGAERWVTFTSLVFQCCSECGY